MQILRAAGIAAALGLTVAACTAEVEDPGEMPTVEIEGGSLPEIDVDPAEIEVTTDTQVVRVPEVNVNP